MDPDPREPPTTIRVLARDRVAVDRPADGPHRPPGYRGLEEFWSRRGYVRHPELVACFDWREIGAERETTHRLTFWLRRAT